ncbi:MAG: 16S rRNA (uracil(1498)-N(3))-methyltransferase [Ligilactobacillus animalis]|uniref:16S rRNA (uracil(1498)-N(3))-methyltransferase n=1 Tax=Ligilactobacillus animalis TaxID=1605 RepID=UPI00242F9DCA|nr:16S rRNA (uracil(1498)-N(3))-methyltransferase [Ligilactobacillus animalis]MCI5941664.1 16S rRNA (uracil(1498)-N(3))-methyltransferase [Ligilactobacillus animalis]MDY2992492.1 16S rRNA (uracil(1498)-N(3))-methyltransferase [Ligilactobacillus animalis]
MQRYFYNEMLANEQFVLPKDIYKHAITVMRMRVGDKFELVTPDKQVQLMEVTAVDKQQARAKVIETFSHQTELPVVTTIACGLSRGDKAELIVQKGTELGADKFIFFKGDFSVAKWDDKKQAKKIARLEKIALAAAEQSHRTTIPTISYCNSLKELKLAADELGIVAYEEAAKQGEKANLVKVIEQLTACKAPQLTAVFGPEGGLSTNEIEILTQAGFIQAGLGPRIMRAETAPLYLLATLSYALELVK